MSLMLSEMAGTRAATINRDEIAAKTTIEISNVHNPTVGRDRSTCEAKGVWDGFELGVGGTREVLPQQEGNVLPSNISNQAIDNDF